MKRAAQIVGLALFIALAVLGAVTLVPAPLRWLHARSAPAILDGIASRPTTDRSPTPNVIGIVLQHHPEVADQTILASELENQGFNVLPEHSWAGRYWESTWCHNWLDVRWKADGGGKVTDLRLDWSVRCGWWI